MSINTQIEQDYKFKLSDFIVTLKDFFSNPSEVEDKKLNEEIKRIENEQDTVYIEKLEKQVNTFIPAKSSKAKRASMKNKEIKAKTISEKGQNKTTDKIVMDEREI